MPSREQQRAKFALEQVRWTVNNARPQASEFKTQLLKLPARLHTNGLGQTVAFYLAAGPERNGEIKAQIRICSWLEKWLQASERPYHGSSFQNRSLIDCITGTGLPDNLEFDAKYRQASQEARALAVWLKRFAEAFIAGEE